MALGVGPWFGRRRDGSEVWDPLGLGSGQSQGRSDDPIALSIPATAHVDWRETDTFHVIRADIPGVRKEVVKVQVEEGNVVQISGERSKEEYDHSDTWHRIERRRGSFVRWFRLPENAELGGIRCRLENGVLTLLIPKKGGADQVAPRASRAVRYIDVA